MHESICIIVLALFSTCFIQCTKVESEKTNVILNVVDDQGYGDIATHGNPWIKTPNIDENLGKLIDFLNDQEIMDNTILIFTADNGSVAGNKLDGDKQYLEFITELQKGETHLQTWFTLDDGVEMGLIM